MKRRIISSVELELLIEKPNLSTPKTMSCLQVNIKTTVSLCKINFPLIETCQLSCIANQLVYIERNIGLSDSLQILLLILSKFKRIN